MKKIALEEHFITTDFIEYTQADFGAMNKSDVDDFIARLSDFESMRIAAMDSAGIDLAILSLTDPGVQREPDTAVAIKLAHKVNDDLARQVSKNPKRFKGFAHLAMQDPKSAAKELERCVRQHQFVGALINGQTLGRYLDEEQFYPFWEKVQELDVPIYLHPGSSYKTSQNYKDHKELEGPLWGWTVETATHALRLIFGGTFDRFPHAKLILGHMGETIPYLLWRLDSRWAIMQHTKKLKKLPSQYIKDNMCVTTSGMCANAPLLCAIEALGEENVLFSVDYPYESSTVAAQFIEKAPISDTLREKICYKNAERILKL